MHFPMHLLSMQVSRLMVMAHGLVRAAHASPSCNFQKVSCHPSLVNYFLGSLYVCDLLIRVSAAASLLSGLQCLDGMTWAAVKSRSLLFNHLHQPMITSGRKLKA